MNVLRILGGIALVGGIVLLKYKLATAPVSWATIIGGGLVFAASTPAMAATPTELRFEQ